jgi:hypothetical protein
MGSSPLAVAVLLQLGAASPGASPPRSSTLTAVAQASARPRECSSHGPTEPRSSASNVWELVRRPNLDRYCSLMARGLAELAAAPKAAFETAQHADLVTPGYAAPEVLMGRASAQMGAFAEAAPHFEKARTIDSRSLADPGTMRDLARMLAHTGRQVEALAVYRALSPRLALFFGGEDRGTILIEAAELAFGIGPSCLDDAIAFLEEARQIPLYGLRTRVLAELALALDRHEMGEEAKSLLRELARDWGKGMKLASTEPGGTELDAAIALVLEAVDPGAAIQAWERFLAAPAGKGPWEGHARGRLEALRKGARPKRRNP